MVEGLADAKGFGERTKDRAAGMEAYRQIAQFYYRLNNLIDYELKKNLVVQFDKAKASKKFTILFEEQFTETWTLDMKLFMVESETLGNVDGTYEGQYTIEIDYDLDGLADVIMKVWEDSFNSEPLRDATATLTNPGMAVASRTLEGKAEAYIHRRSTSNCTIHPNQSSDKKAVNVFGISIHVYTVTTGDIENRDIEYFGNEEGLSFHHRNFESVTTDGYVHTLPDYTESPDSLKSYGDMYQRGDKAKDGWKIRITPTGKK